MMLSRKSVEMLIDLAENKLSTMEVFDRDDQEQADILRRTLSELGGIIHGQQRGIEENNSSVLAMDAIRRRGRRPRSLMSPMMG